MPPIGAWAASWLTIINDASARDPSPISTPDDAARARPPGRAPYRYLASHSVTPCVRLLVAHRLTVDQQVMRRSAQGKGRCHAGYQRKFPSEQKRVEIYDDDGVKMFPGVQGRTFDLRWLPRNGNHPSTSSVRRRPRTSGSTHMARCYRSTKSGTLWTQRMVQDTVNRGHFTGFALVMHVRYPVPLPEGYRR